MPKVGMAEFRRNQIRSAAAIVLAKNGFEGATMMRVARTARVSTGLINHYYPNKLAMLVDCLEFASEWFQSSIRRSIAGKLGSREKLRALIHISFFNRSAAAQRGHKIWILAVAESLRSKSVAQVILTRRKLFRRIIADVLKELPACRAMNEDVIWNLASEIDAYLSGFSLHYVSGDLHLSPAAVERTLLSIVEAHRHLPAPAAGATTD
jgi:TetR/AcrR family transcriptional regulator, transcriptional repressor of bet genes